MSAEKAYLTVRNAYSNSLNASELAATLKEAMDLFAQDKSDGGFMAKTTEGQLKLMAFQSKMTAKHGSSFLNLPVGDTLLK